MVVRAALPLTAFVDVSRGVSRDTAEKRGAVPGRDVQRRRERGRDKQQRGAQYP